LAKRELEDGFEFTVTTAPATARHRQLAFIVVIAAFVAYVAVIPYATIPLPRIDSFLPTVYAVIFLADLVTAVLLYAQFSATSSRPLLVLASGYLFSSLIVVGHALTFPGAFVPTGFLWAGPQSSAWLNVSWRLGLAAAMALYGVLRFTNQTNNAVVSAPRYAISWSAAIVIVVVCTLVYAVTAGHDLLPPVLLDGTILPLGYYVNGAIALTNLLALLFLLVLTRGKSILDLWLMVAAFALLAESMVVTFYVAERFSVAHYAIRMISLPVSKVVLVVLLWETMRIYANLSIANRNLQREQANRLTSVEAVVAALAHEVRQPLTGMTSRAAAGKRFLDQAPSDPRIDKAKTLFDQIKDAAFRANEVFESFLSLFRGDRQEHQAVDINVLALEAVQLLRKELDDHNIVAHTMLESELPTIQGNRGQLREVILNLVQNSIEALATITKQRVISIVSGRHDSHSISISLEDTGPGIDPNKLASIFDPFVTTKAKGTGLGLAICKMIIEQHGGKLSASSDTHYGGARFEITLPTKNAKRSVPGAAMEQSPLARMSH
jgi:signal transduction histidine kinase